jgi:hypothetical protein
MSDNDDLVISLRKELAQRDEYIDILENTIRRGQEEISQSIETLKKATEAASAETKQLLNTDLKKLMVALVGMVRQFGRIGDPNDGTEAGEALRVAIETLRELRERE